MLGMWLVFVCCVVVVCWMCVIGWCVSMIVCVCGCVCVEYCVLVVHIGCAGDMLCVCLVWFSVLFFFVCLDVVFV